MGLDELPSQKRVEVKISFYWDFTKNVKEWRYLVSKPLGLWVEETDTIGGEGEVLKRLSEEKLLAGGQWNKTLGVRQESHAAGGASLEQELGQDVSKPQKFYPETGRSRPVFLLDLGLNVPECT